MRKIIALGIVLLFLGMTISSSTGLYLEKQSTVTTLDGNTLYVGGSGPGNYSSIQEAIDDAFDGDTIYVYDDSSPYYENIVIDKSINLIGEDRDTTIIEWEEIGSNVVTLLADGICLESFTLIGAGIGNSGRGILINSSNNLIINTCVKNNGDGIMSRSYNNNNFIDNFIIENGWGMSISHSYDNNFYRNYFKNYIVQLYSGASEDNIISNNIFCVVMEDPGPFWEGLLVVRDNRDIISNNSFYNCGLDLSHSSDNCIIFNNTVNGKPLLYLEGVSDIKIEEDVGQVILENCYNISVQKIEFLNVSNGIQIYDSDSCSLIDNVIKNTNEGICCKYSKNICIRKNNISDSGHALQIVFCYDSLIEDNNINNGLSVGISNCKNITIRNNIIANNDRSALDLLFTENCFISNNSIYNNKRGIHLKYDSKNNVIFNNDIRDNLRFGICLSEGTNNNNILCNNFFRNFPNAYYIQNLSNKWDGNYWNRIRFLPKFIFGFKDENKIFPSFINFDWHPALFPYDIGV